MKYPDICCILLYAAHYRFAIYKEMEDELDCDFYFGTHKKLTVKKMNYAPFRKKITDLPLKYFGVFYRMAGAFPLVFKPYKKYVLTGDILCVSNWMVLFFAKILGKKTYLWTHGWYGDEEKWKILLKKTFFGLSTGVFLYGDHAKKLMIENGISSDKLHVVYNSMDYERQILVRGELKETSVYKEHFGNDYPVLIFTGRLNKGKMLDLLIEAQLKLHNIGYLFNVVLVGDGPEQEILKKKVSNLNLVEYFWFFGACYDEEIIGNFYYNAFLCTTPGDIGLTAIHSMMYGCPVITHSDFFRHGPEFEIIEKGKTGDLFTYGDVDSLVNTIIAWIQKYPVKTKKLMMECFKKVDEKYNAYYQIKVLKSVLQ